MKSYGDLKHKTYAIFTTIQETIFWRKRRRIKETCCIELLRGGEHFTGNLLLKRDRRRDKETCCIELFGGGENMVFEQKFRILLKVKEMKYSYRNSPSQNPKCTLETNPIRVHSYKIHVKILCSEHSLSRGLFDSKGPTGILENSSS